jgi:hypothetical protein
MTEPLGFRTAKRVVQLGRGAFFQDPETDLPNGRSVILRADDLTPQFGFVGSRFAEARVLLLGINPGNGPRNDIRTPNDARMMPSIRQFAEDPTEKNFVDASNAYQAECKHWPIWKRHCSEIVGAGKLSIDDIAYSNCLPWRTESQSNFDDSVARKAAQLFAAPLIEELKPKVIIALGKRANAILRMADAIPAHIITWNRAQAMTPAVRQERSGAAALIFQLLARDPVVTAG